MNVASSIVIGAVVAVGAVAAGLVAFSAVVARRIERAVPPDGAFMDVTGGRLHYLDAGSGPAIVIVHGLGGQLRNFRYALLARLTPRFRVILVDRPGSGYSSVSGAFPSLRAQAAAIAELVGRLGLDRPLLVGHSLGGALSLALAVDHPGLVSGLALIAPLTQHDLGEVPPAFRLLAIQSPWLRRIVSWTLVAPMARLAGSERRAVVFAPDPVPADWEVAGGGLLTVRPNGFAAASADLVQVPRDLPSIEARYSSLRLPVDILFGRGDSILDPAVQGGRLVQQVPGARLDLIDGGHMIPATQPDRTADWLVAVHERQSA